MGKQKGKLNLKKISVLLVLVILINLPAISALEISNLFVDDLSATGATINWETDEPADSFVSYGENKDDLSLVGDAKTVYGHQITLTDLLPEKTYYYNVESNNLIVDNSGELYSFTTLPPDVTAPELNVEMPTIIAGVILDIYGETEIDAKVELFVNDKIVANTLVTEPVMVLEDNLDEATETESSANLVGDATSTSKNENQVKSLGEFTFFNVELKEDFLNNVTVVAYDEAGNNVTYSTTIFADIHKPNLVLEKTYNLTEENVIDVKGVFSEEVNYEIFVNDNSQASGFGNTLDDSVNLEEGDNSVRIVFSDVAGWENTEEFSVYSDTQAPTVTVELAKGNEYYQGRATSDIFGTTEPEATVYLYVYRPINYEYNPKFDKAWAKVTAGKDGNYTFTNVNFETEPFDTTWEEFAPKEIPSGLVDYSIFPISQVADQERWSYQIFLIAEDKTGKTGYAQTSVTVNTCYSGNWDFQVQAIAQFQAPLRLNPTLLDDGRETISSAFNLTYTGSASPKVDLISGEVTDPAFEIVNVEFERACTQSMLDDDKFKLGCSIIDTRLNGLPNYDKTAWYVTSDLHSAEELSSRESDFWNDFKKRMVVFPLKTKITYRERDVDGQLGPVKTQMSCTDLSYYIDIPIDSKEMLPDWVADEGLDSIEWTIEKIDLVMPYLEKAILVAGVSCISSFLGRMVIRWMRIFSQKFEPYSTKVKGTEASCPANQNSLILDSTKKHWEDLSVKGLFASNGENNPSHVNKEWQDEKSSLDKRCPNTANLWRIESYLDQAYRWTCDRVYCRAVPAKWTASKEKTEVDTVILEQNQCSVASKGIALVEVENCQDVIAKNYDVTKPNALYETKKKNGAFTCYRYDNKLYIISSEQNQGVLPEGGQIIKLEQIYDYGLTLQEATKYVGATNLIAYLPPNSNQFIVAQDTSCESACRAQAGYKADVTGGIKSYLLDGSSGQFGCYRETEDVLGKSISLVNDNQQKITQTKVSAGYTKDCFIDFKEGGTYSQQPQKSGDVYTTGLLQCVCVQDEKAQQFYGTRVAAKAGKDGEEDWIYRQDRIYKESNGRQGTYYPEWRYYNGRDFSSAFGANYLLDYAREGQEEVHEINPNSQMIGAFQTVCLSGIRARLVILRSVLEGLKNCIEEAKYTGLHDAGVCKTIFTQHVCGLLYKVIAYFFKGCSPYSMSDVAKEGTLEGVGEFFSAGFSSIGESMQSSIDDIKADYGNAKLNEFFATGTKGFVTSICMAAFGYDWPMGMDFILDSAYAVPMKTTVHVIPAEREFTTYNPQAETAVYNYEVGAMVLPGCQIESYDVYLKCVGPEDQVYPGVQCGSQGCDCIRATQSSTVEGERIHYLDGGRGFDLQQGSFTSIPILAPQKVDTHYRYDHVVVELKLSPYEDPTKCFDEGYRDGKFYFPIVDISPAGAFNCQIQPLTGKYTCPDFAGLFGQGEGTYFEDPFMTCYQKSTDSYVSCNTPNLFIKGDEIKAKLHLRSDGNDACIKAKVSGLQTDVLPTTPKNLQSGISGTYTEVINLGTVTDEMFGSSSGYTVILSSDSSAGCSQPMLVTSPSTITTGTSYRFDYKLNNGQYTVTPDNNVKLLSGFSASNSYTADQLQKFQFVLGGFTVNNLIGPAQADNNQQGHCTYQLAAVGGSISSSGQKSITLSAEILKPDATGSCFNANIPMKASAFGRSSISQTLVLQKETITQQVVSKMFPEFEAKNYDYVIDQASTIINYKRSDLEDAKAFYYLIASYIMMGGVEGAKATITTNLKTFFNYQYPTGDAKIPYGTEVINTSEYQKIKAYLCLVAEEVNFETNGKCSNE